MGRDDKQGKSNNKGSLSQTPENLKIAPNNIKNEMASEFAELDKGKKRRNK